VVPVKAKVSLGGGPSKALYMDYRELAEIFSVRFLASENLNFKDVYGAIFVTGLHNYVVFERLFGDPVCIDSEVSLLIFLLLFSFIENTNYRMWGNPLMISVLFILALILFSVDLFLSNCLFPFFFGFRVTSD
jgi:Na+-transporting NADH:ubiquinone oxidoreductase subunit NqrB